MVGSIEVRVGRPVLSGETDHLGGMTFPQGPCPSVSNAPHEIAALRWRVNTTEENDRQGGTLVPLEHRDESFLEHTVSRFVDTTCITPCPMEPGIPNDHAKHLQLVVSRRLLQVVHNDVYDLVEQRFMFFLLVREHNIAEILCNLSLDVGIVDVRRHRGDQHLKDWERWRSL